MPAGSSGGKENRYKFVGFTERVAGISVDVLRQRRRGQGSGDGPQDEETFFRETLTTALELDQSPHFADFAKSLGRVEVGTYPELLHSAPAIVTAIEEHLKVPGTAARRTLLELTVALAKDLGDEFQPHFWRLWSPVWGIVEGSVQDPEALEEAFSATAALVKVVWRGLRTELPRAYRRLFAALAHRREHVRRFAAEAFAFLLAKAPAKAEFLEYGLGLVAEKLEGDEWRTRRAAAINGFAALWFQVMRGVKGQLWSGTPEVLELVLGACVGQPEGSVRREFLREVVGKLVVQAKEPVAQSVLHFPILARLQAAVGGAEWAQCLQLLEALLSRRDGNLLKTPTSAESAKLLELALQAAQIEPAAEEAEECLCKHLELTASVLAVSPGLDPESAHLRRLAAAVFRSTMSRAVQLRFLSATSSLGGFVTVVLGALVQLLEASEEPSEELLRGLLPLAERQLPFHAEELPSRPPTLLGHTAPAFARRLASRWRDFGSPALFLLPYLGAPEDWQEAFQKICKDPETPAEQLWLACRGLLLLNGFSSAPLSLEDILPRLEKEPSDSFLLTLASQVIGKREDPKLFGRLAGLLAPNLRSPLQHLRQLSLQLLCAFEGPFGEERTEDEPALCERSSAYAVCLEALRTSPTLQDGGFQSRLRLLRKLERTTAQRLHLPRDSGTSEEAEGMEPHEEAVFSFLLGELHVEMEPLWKGVAGLLDSYVQSPGFWPLYAQLLQDAQLKARSPPEAHPDADDSESQDLESAWSSVSSPPSRRSAKWGHFRLHLWSLLNRCPSVARGKTRHFVPALLEHYEGEYLRDEDRAAPTQDLTKEDRDGEDHESRAGSRKESRKLLLQQLEALAGMGKPGSFFRGAELETMELELLLSATDEVQIKALACLLAAKPPHVAPYAANLQRLAKDESFRSELTCFSIDTENVAVEEAHRPAVVPLLHRLLYGKLLGAGKQQARRKAIFAYLTGSEPHELTAFLRLLFRDVVPLADSEASLAELLSGLKTEPSAVVPLRRLQGLLGSFSLVLGNLGPRLASLLPWLLRLLLVLAATVRQLEAERQAERVLARYKGALKGLRGALLDALHDFMSINETYAYSKDELSAISEAAGGQQKLLFLWTKIPRYFPLLALPQADGKTAVDSLVALLVDPSTNAQSQAQVLDALHSLVTTDDFRPSAASGPALDVDLQLSQASGKAGLGTRLLLPHLIEILSFFQQRLEGSKGARALNQTNLTLLSRLAPFCEDEGRSVALGGLLLRFFSGPKGPSIRGPGQQAQTLRVVAELVSAHPAAFRESLAQLAKLLSLTKERVVRDALVAVLAALAKGLPQDEEWIGVVVELNAWHRKRLEEPDFDRRLAGFRALKTLVGRAEGCETAFLALLHQCVHTLNTAEDISLRDSAASALGALVDGLPSLEGWEGFVTSHVLKLLSFGLKRETEAVRQAYIGLLGRLVAVAPDHPKLRGLAELRSPDDPDLDFFLNLCHIQLHRRTRALRRLNDRLDEGLAMSSEVIASFLLPPALPFLFQPSYRSNSGLGDEALRLLGTLARRSSWGRYQPLLKHHLWQLHKAAPELQRTQVRCLVALLDGFHFDLSACAPEDSAQLSIAQRDKLAKETREAQAAAEEEKEDAEEPETMDTDEAQPDAAQPETYEKNQEKEIYRFLVSHLIPKLQASLSKRRSKESQHKLGGSAAEAKSEDEGRDLQRLPIALALVKLLHKLPRRLLDQQLPSVLGKLAVLLRSRSRDTRDATRKTLVGCLAELGPRYLPYAVKELKESLPRGYQVHVCIYTTHTLISSLSESLGQGDLDPCLPDILEMCSRDLFGEQAEEKEVEAITRGLVEARARKTRPTYTVLGRLLSPALLSNVIRPLREVLESRQAESVRSKVREVLGAFAHGLVQNSAFSPPQALLLVHQTLTAHLPDLSPKPLAPAEDQRPGRRPASALLIPKEPGRSGAAVKTARASSLHVLVEFALQLLHNLLSSPRFRPPRAVDQGKEKDGEEAASPAQRSLAEQLDPFVGLVSQALAAKFDRVIALALRCLCGLLKHPLPALRPQGAKDLNSLAAKLFVLLHHYGGLGASGTKGETADVVQHLFKALTLLIRSAEFFHLSDSQLEALLHYAEADVAEPGKQATAFPLLKAILRRGLASDRLPDLLKSVAAIAVQDSNEPVRVQARHTLQIFLLEHPQGRRPRQMLEFLLAQLAYEEEEGRVSALELLSALFQQLPEQRLSPLAALCFVQMAARLGHVEETDRVKALLGLAIGQLISSLQDKARAQLWNLTAVWLAEKNKPAHASLGAALVRVWLKALPAQVRDASETVLQGLCGLLGLEDGTEDPTMGPVLTTASQLLALEGVSADEAPVWALVERYLGSKTKSVQLAASQLCGQLLSAHKPEELRRGSAQGWLAEDGDAKLRSVAGRLIWQLKAPDLPADVTEQALKNLVFIGRSLSPEGLEWLGRKLSLVAKRELVFASTQSQAPGAETSAKRSAAFKWLAAMALQLEPRELRERLLGELLGPLERELSVGAEGSLAKLAGEVADVLRRRLGDDDWAALLAAASQASAKERAQRRKKKLQEAVSDPEAAAKRRAAKQKNKVKAKKRRILAEKPHRAKKARNAE